MDEWQKNFKAEDFDLKIDPKQMDEFKQQMDQFRKDLKPEDLQVAPN